MKYALILVATLIVPPMDSVAAPALRTPPGWLGLGYTYNVTSTPGVRIVWLFVRQVAPGGPADQAGVKPQDVITEINGRKISFKDEFDALTFFGRIKPGDTLRLTLKRGRITTKIAIVASSLPSDMAQQRRINAEVAKAQRRRPQ